ncbi:proteasome activator complex subunit 3-like isoform X3 [Anneissia japonica]|uniref:proteasome activator complex subunit 3-like isoform X1 n=1 Tax=Anneissia japonica TaxID=1529436 RepID=UPI001425A66C|nr:proteasome activator complex subunit 3-like isoform X1 [Anneissia japonica]XP_033103228.1 proteasome activator complex subunit 3-like isoform X2 [Anneissia japonica]XP_033103229.1 proteasome activator complex subunit 3-like isoform X3 [Anneissia japonica]
MAEYEEKIEQYRKDLEENAKLIIKNDFPKTIMELNDLLTSDLFDIKNMPNVTVKLNLPVPDPVVLNSHESLGKRKRLDDDVSGSLVMSFPDGMVPCNEHIMKLINLMKPQIMSLIERCNQIKMWIQLLIPRIEDGNNFGVSIQEDTLSEVRQVEGEAGAYLDQISRYFITRAKLVSKVAKYPHVGDYRQSVKEIDEKEFVNLRLICAELRNSYLGMFDLISKNKEKIIRPRTSNSQALY